ncbi:MAG: uroporphyrinogen-III C-methyltransferase [Deltaproteobacteria bacterium]|nr:uroporphyrinogen-III C-methyltransferase [Deltaproteobacteria bacterium]
MIGTVYLVGAGPGDPGLITVRGLAVLRGADVVVHDHLVPRALLAEAKPGAEIVYAGKRAADHIMRQARINELLVERALAGLAVCRLKGGDPFVFGRGGEEALHLAEHGVPFEIVPGVTAAVGVPAYAGIPVTHRAFCASVSISTGHEDPEKDGSDIDWTGLAGPKKTVVFYMGVRNLASIAAKLTEAGLAGDTPAALVHRGATAQQRTAVGTLATIARIAETEKFEPPCLIVVGEVVRLREKLAWFENRPLFGRSVVLTRPRERGGLLKDALASRGAHVIEFPTIRIVPPEDGAPLRDAAARVDEFYGLIVTSASAVEPFFEALLATGRDARALAGLLVAAVGPATAEALRARGIVPDLLPEKAHAESLAQALASRGGLAGKRFLFPQGDLAGDALARALEAEGASVTGVVAYRNIPEAWNGRAVAALFEERTPDAVVFTSPSTARNLAACLGTERYERWKSSPCVFASIGPRNDAGDEGVGAARRP